MNIKIIEPAGVFYDGEGNFMEFTAKAGQMGVYPKHFPLATILEPCEIRIHKDDGLKTVVVQEGFVEIQQDSVIILTEGATLRTFE